MTFRVGQIWILSIFMISLLLQLFLIAVDYGRNAIYPDDLRNLVVRFLAIYSVPLGVVISGIFAKSAPSTQLAPKRAFWVAISLAAVWNLLIVGRTLLFTISATDKVNALVEYVDAVVATSSFLTVAALTYFFTTDQEGKPHE